MKLVWVGGAGNEVCVTDDGAVYSIQSVGSKDHILQAIGPDGSTRLGDTEFLGVSCPNVDTAKARAQMIEDAR